MAGTDRRVTFIIAANVKNFANGLDRAQKRFRRFGRDLQRTGRSLTQNVTVPLGIIGGLALKTAADFETLQQSMNVLNGSIEEGARNFERLKEFSARTPFRLKGLASAQNMLQGFGLSADQAFQSLSMIGDIAAVTGGDIKGIGIAFGQAAAEGRLMTRDIRQLINQGVPAIQLLADTMDVATSDVLDLASQGKISFDILVQAFQDATTAGGMFANGMEKQANTLAGLWSTLRDNIDIALGELGDSIVETFDLKTLIRDLTSNLRVIVQRFQEMSKESKAQILQVVGLFAAGGPLLIVLGQAAVAITGFAKLVRSRFILITAAVSLAIGRFEQVQQMWSNFVARMNNQKTTKVDDFFTALRKGLGDIAEFTGVFEGLNSGLEEFQKLISGLGGRATDPDKFLDNIVSKTKGNRDVFGGMGGGAGGGGQISNPFARAGNPIEAVRSSVRDLGTDIGNTAKQYRKNLSDMMASGAQFASATRAATITMGDRWKQFKDTVVNVSEELESQAIQQIQSAVLSFGNIVGKTLAGVENSFATTFEKVVLVLLNFAKSLVKLAAGIGSLMLFIPGMQGVGAGVLAASAALQAIITGVEAGIQKRISNRENRSQNMARGGIVPPGFPNDTYPAMLSSGETVIPSPKPLSAGMGGGQVIENVINIDGQIFYKNQQEVQYKRDR